MTGTGDGMLKRPIPDRLPLLIDRDLVLLGEVSSALGFGTFNLKIDLDCIDIWDSYAVCSLGDGELYTCRLKACYFK